LWLGWTAAVEREVARRRELGSDPGLARLQSRAIRGGRQPLGPSEFWPDLAAFDGDTIVGSATVFSFQMRLPGAMAAVAGVSLVAVLPSHRCQVILSALM